jgi:cytoskeletal protein CcmA (bactofilin family)
MADKPAGGELSLVGTGTVVEGKIKTDGSIRIDGKIVGDLIAKANVAVGLGGVVEGNLIGKNVSLAGKVVGTVEASEKLVLEPKSMVKGDIRAARLVVDEGAVFDGQCLMSSSSTPGKPEGKLHS